MNHPARRPVPTRIDPARGFTLVELMISLAVLGVLLMIAVPSFSQLLAANRLTTQTGELITSLNLARGEAVRRAQAVTFSASDIDNLGKGWTVFPDANSDGSAASSTSDTDGKPLREIGAFRGSNTFKRVTYTAPSTYADSTDSARGTLIFTSRGALTVTTDAYFRLCDPANPALKGRVVRVNVVGKVSIQNVAASCS